MGAEITTKKEYKSVSINIDDLLNVIKKASEQIVELKHERLGARLSYTIGLKGDKQITTDDFDEFREQLFEYGASELQKIDISLSNYNDRFNLSFNYKYSSIGNLEIRTTSTNNNFVNLSDILDRKTHPTLNRMFHGLMGTMVIVFALSAILTGLVAWLLSIFFTFSSAELAGLLWLLFIFFELSFLALNEKWLSYVYPAIVLKGNDNFGTKGRILNEDIKRMWVWLVALVLGGIILTLLKLN